MKTKPIILLLVTTAWISIIFLCSYNSFAQKDVMELTFTAINNTSHIQLDSIKIINQTQSGDTVLYWPDTVLSLYFVSISEFEKEKDDFRIFQNYPNPVAEQTTISLNVPEKDQVNLVVTDMKGLVIIRSERILDKGINSFRFTPGGGNLYFFTAQWRGTSKSIKILQAFSHSNCMSSLEYTGYKTATLNLKAIEDMQNFSFNPGDELLYIGYVNNLQSGMLDSPEYSDLYTFQFATNIPCPATPTVTYEGQIYNTVQIFNQCWLKENLNIGIMIPADQMMSNNNIIEKYCARNNSDSCEKYGGLYLWWEMMQYATQEGIQGICPAGWHIPTDNEWKILEGSADSQFGIGDITWDVWAYRGFDVGENLKTTTGWLLDSNGTNLVGYSGLPGGRKFGTGSFGLPGGAGSWWTSSMVNYSGAWSRTIDIYNSGVYRDSEDDGYGFSVRCIKN